MEFESTNLVTISCADHSQYVAMALRNLFHSKRGTDFDFRLGNKSVRAHRLILELFLAPEFAGTVQDEVSVLPAVKQELPDDGNGSGINILDFLVEFLYNGEVDVPEQQLEELLKVAEELDFKLLIDAIQVCRPIDIVAEDKVNIDMNCDLYSSDNVNEFEGLEEIRIEDVKYTQETFDNSKSLQPNINCGITFTPCFVNLESKVSDSYQSTQADTEDFPEVSNPKRLQSHVKPKPADKSVDLQSGLEDSPESLREVLPNSDRDEEDCDGAPRDDSLDPGTSSNTYKKNTSMFKCPHCDFETPKYQGQVNHLLQVHGLTAKETPAPMRKCPNCEFQTSSRYLYRRHCFSVHQLTVLGVPVPLQKCPNCEYSTAWTRSFNKHLATVHNQKPKIGHACPQCSYVGNMRIHLEQHLFLVHGVGVSRFTCKVCGKHFISRSKLDLHSRSHTNERPFKCPSCSYTAINVTSLKRHTNAIHGEGESSFTCDVCQKRFNTRGRLKIHVRTHTKERPFKCTLCSYAAIQSPTLQTHMWVTHGEGDYGITCEVCRKRFRSSSEMVVHARSHSNERPFKCPRCSYAANSGAHLKRHMNSVHGEGDSSFTCDVCQKRFNTRARLKIHGRTHTKERPFKCTLCNHATVESVLLQTHMWVTHGVGDCGFTCELCQKRFRCSSELDCHIRMHSNERPFKCPHCPFASKQVRSLRRHVRLVH